jgi:hypothetical protein
VNSSIRQVRRRLYWLALLALVMLWPATRSARAQDIHEVGPNLFYAGIPTDEFEYFAAPQSVGRQRQENWCWAATIQMVLNYHGLRVTQEQVVERVFGGDVNMPGDIRAYLTALSGWAFQLNGRPAQIFSRVREMDVQGMIDDLSWHWPLIVGLRNKNANIGHAYVLTSIRFALDENNQPIPVSVVLRDPWPSNPSRQIIDWGEFQSRIEHYIQVRIRRT